MSDLQDDIMPQDVPNAGWQLVLFDSQRKIHCKSASSSSHLSDSRLLDNYMHKLLASRSISTALFDGVTATNADNSDTNTKSTHHVYLNRRRIQLPHRDRALVVTTRRGHVLAGYPISDTSDLWLGLFTDASSSLLLSATNDHFCSILEALAFAAQILPPLHLDSLVPRFDYLYSLLLDRAGCQDSLKKLLFLLMRSPISSSSSTTPNSDIVSFISYPESSLTRSLLSPSASIPQFEESILESLRPAKYPVRAPWWVVAACILTKDGVLLKAEGVSRAISRILCWRYDCFSPEDKRLSGNVDSGLQEYRNGILLRSWYSMGPISLCVLTSQAVSTQASTVTGEDLQGLAKRAFSLLVKVKSHYAA